MATTQSSSKPKRTTTHRATTASKSADSRGNLQEHIAVAAYYRAESRNFEPGYEMEDWLAAEADVVGK